MRTRRLAGMVISVGVVVGVVLALTACNGGTPGPVNPTHGGPNGECIEFDGEPCDDDPFDTDDLFEHKKTPSPYRLKSPAPKTSSKTTVKVRR